jgi:hypothetical protein
VWLVHGETESSAALRDVLRASGATAEVARPGLRVDLGAAA